jgi:tetratricopeptide (TPR) repeat protein
MVNLLEEELFDKIERKKKGEDIFIGLNSAMLVVSGINTPEKCKTELEKIYLFNEQFRKWYKNNWGSVLSKQNSMHKAISIFGYMYERLNKIKEDAETIRKGDAFLTNNPFQGIGKNQEIFASWISLCARQEINEIKLLSDGEKLRGCFNNGQKDYIFNPAKQSCLELDKDSGYIKYSKSAIVPEILTQRAWGRYKSGRFLEAIEDCNKALIIAPTYINSLFCRGVSKKEIGIKKRNSQMYLQGAIQDFETLTNVKSNYVQAYFEMMGIYWKLGNTEKANECKNRVYTLGKESWRRLIEEEVKKTKRTSWLNKILSFKN